MGTPSNLILDALGLGDGSGLGVRESLRPLENGQRRRTINGVLKHLGSAGFRQYELTIGSDDVQPPALGDLWPGDVVTVVPISELGHVIGHQGTTVTLGRDPYVGSVRTRDSAGRSVPFAIAGRVVTLEAPADGVVRVFYRPVLRMMLAEPWSQDEAESGGPLSTGWSLSLAEVSS